MQYPFISGNATSGDVISGDATSGDVISGDATSDDATSGDVISGERTMELRIQPVSSHYSAITPFFPPDLRNQP
jgi:hypothetical protein